MGTWVAWHLGRSLAASQEAQRAAAVLPVPAGTGARVAARPSSAGHPGAHRLGRPRSVPRGPAAQGRPLLAGHGARRCAAWLPSCGCLGRRRTRRRGGGCWGGGLPRGPAASQPWWRLRSTVPTPGGTSRCGDMPLSVGAQGLSPTLGTDGRAGGAAGVACGSVPSSLPSCRCPAQTRSSPHVSALAAGPGLGAGPCGACP